MPDLRPIGDIHASSGTDMPDRRLSMGKICISYGSPMRHIGLRWDSNQTCWSPMRHVSLQWVSYNNNIFVNSSFSLFPVQSYPFITLFSHFYPLFPCGISTFFFSAEFLVIMDYGLVLIKSRTTWLEGRLVMTARGKPNPRKYGQLVSTKSNRLCSSKP